jgi:chromosome segregation ATPase
MNQAHSREINDVKKEYETKIRRITADLQVQVKEKERQRISFTEQVTQLRQKCKNATKEIETLREKLQGAKREIEKSSGRHKINDKRNNGGSVAQAISSIVEGV